MATKVPKSYQATVTHGGPAGATPAPGGPGPAQPGGPGPNTGGPAPPGSDGKGLTDVVFKVPAGKAWLVLKLLWRVPASSGALTSFAIEKANGSGTQQTVLFKTKLTPVKFAVDEDANEIENARNLVLEDQEVIRQVLSVTGRSTLTVQYEISVLEITP